MKYLILILAIFILNCPVHAADIGFHYGMDGRFNVQRGTLGVNGGAIRPELHVSLHDADALEFGFNMIGRWYLIENHLYFGGLLGLSYFPGEIEHFGDSDVLGSFGGLIGLEFLEKFSLEARYTHSSDPFDKDVGRNYFSIGLNVSF